MDAWTNKHGEEQRRGAVVQSVLRLSPHIHLSTRGIVQSRVPILHVLTRLGFVLYVKPAYISGRKALYAEFVEAEPAQYW